MQTTMKIFYVIGGEIGDGHRLQKIFLPDDGMGGFMVYDGQVPICAGFMYVTNSKAAWCDWIISNLKYKDRQKKKRSFRVIS